MERHRRRFPLAPDQIRDLMESAASAKYFQLLNELETVETIKKTLTKQKEMWRDEVRIFEGSSRPKDSDEPDRMLLPSQDVRKLLELDSTDPIIIGVKKYIE